MCAQVVALCRCAWWAEGQARTSWGRGGVGGTATASAGPGADDAGAAASVAGSGADAAGAAASVAGSGADAAGAASVAVDGGVAPLLAFKKPWRTSSTSGRPRSAACQCTWRPAVSRTSRGLRVIGRRWPTALQCGHLSTRYQTFGRTHSTRYALAGCLNKTGGDIANGRGRLCRTDSGLQRS